MTSHKWPSTTTALRNSARASVVLYLRSIGQESLARRVDMCQPTFKGFRCRKSWLCDSCWIAEALIVQMDAVGRTFCALVNEPELIFVHATLGVGTFSTWQAGHTVIRETLTALLNGHSKSWATVAGGYWITEFEQRVTGKFAPHIHMLVAFNPATAPRWIGLPGCVWARTARAIRKPNRSFDPLGSSDSLLRELMESKRVEFLDAYEIPFGSPYGLRLPKQAEDLGAVFADVWNLAGYAKKSKRVARSGYSRNTRELPLRARVELHLSKVNRRGSFGVLRAHPAFGAYHRSVGQLVSRALQLGPFAPRAPSTESGRVCYPPPAPQRVLELFRRATRSTNPSLREIAYQALRITESAAPAPPSLRERGEVCHADVAPLVRGRAAVAKKRTRKNK